MSSIKKISVLIIGILLIAGFAQAFVPHTSTGSNTAAAADEIRLTKGLSVYDEDAAQTYIAYRAYRDGGYNIYVDTLTDNVTAASSYASEVKANDKPLSVDAIGPKSFQRYVYWVDHLPAGWTINQYDTQTGTGRVVVETQDPISYFSMDDAHIAYITHAINTNFTDLFLFSLIDGSTKKLTDGAAVQMSAAVWGTNVVWTQSPDGSKEKGVLMRYQTDSSVTSQLTNDTGVIQVQLVALTVAYTHIVNTHAALSIYYLNVGNKYDLTSSNVSVSDPSLSADVVAYITDDGHSQQINYFRFGQNIFGTLTAGSAKKLPPHVSLDGNHISWIDDRMGAPDVFYYGFNLDASKINQDGDRMSDAEKIKLGLNPYEKDTDHDGLTDYEEVYIYHTDPAKWDTYGNGVSDGYEVHHLHIIPHKFSNNSTGISDSVQLQMGLNPAVEHQEFTGYKGVMRLPSLGDEYRQSIVLRENLNTLLGRGWRTSKQKWFTMVNAYVYGGYTSEEAASYSRGNRFALSDNTPAQYWRAYQASLGHSTTKYVAYRNAAKGVHSAKKKIYTSVNVKTTPLSSKETYATTPDSVKNVYKATYYLLP